MEDKSNSETNKADSVNNKGSTDTCQSDIQLKNNTEPASNSNNAASIPKVALTTADGKIKQANVVRPLTISSVHGSTQKHIHSPTN